METIRFKKLHPDAQLPTKNDGDIGWDFYVINDWENYSTPYELKSGYRRTFSIGLAPSLPKGLNLLLWDRSGLSVKNGIHRLAGVIDSTYQGEILVCLLNTSDETVFFHSGDRIIQGIFQWEVPVQMEWTEEFQTTERGAAGFGSSGR